MSEHRREGQFGRGHDDGLVPLAPLDLANTGSVDALLRAMSRTAALRHAQGRRIDQELAKKGVVARAQSWKGLAEEQPDAYKDVNLVVDVVHQAGLSKKVARMRPIGVIKG